MAQKGFYYDQTACIGCKVCQVACKDKNDLKVGPRYRRVYDMETGKYPNPRRAHFSISCNHCDNPKCVENCPTGALSKGSEDGLVLHDREKCIGCRLCIWSCPYEAPQYKEDEGKVGKCDGCSDLLAKGENPACVDACVMRCLEFGDIEELRQKYGKNADAKGLPSSSTTNPNLVINAKQI
ncbi:MAG: DMSO/selenate family reductase complex B subunit [Desulfitobacterium sp.]